ncbi:molybdopterin oxidoreductase [Steroidobacter agaridevorans]|uniref:Molybdopterin oxidoreductase n=1 Tax=Steroidobacter agaridevorans TaxID=2695856 RepID=A0A829YKS7_9GAMM|nr:molybdopterin-dependent oxidoreductase [Steroidobacter agaridevorans]GFE83850.1 molybdopterin oxidoreductase [Steroidobacter agaridevorans]GFE91562.1 molybdopterin oxidoreductase [Steroidobacter agaridevorans]
MKQPNRMLRRAFIKGMASSAGVMLAGCSQTDPPTYGHVLRMGDLLTYKAHRLLLPAQALAREYDYADISSVPAIGTTNPSGHKEHGATYERLLANRFTDWRLPVEGSVTRPRAFSLDELKRLPSRTQITRHTCEEGWSAIAQWTGVPLRSVLESAGIRSTARFVQFYAYDGWVDGIDMLDALHPQTILAYGMNGRELPISHGAPLRARVETQLGYKSTKFLRRIVVTDNFDDHGARGFIQNGWSWYAGI